MLAMEAGGADVIELGVPFTDPLADGKAIQECNTKAIEQGVDYEQCLEFVREARAQGLKTPVILMGECTAAGWRRRVHETPKQDTSTLSLRTRRLLPFATPRPPVRMDSSWLTFPRRRLSASARSARRKGESRASRDWYMTVLTVVPHSMSYIPLIAPSTTDARIAFLASIADSFIYVVSKMGTTGASTTVSASLPSLLERIRAILPTKIPLAVGFGVSTQQHFQEVGAVADGVVIGSRLISVIENADQTALPAAVTAYCHEVSSNRVRAAAASTPSGPHTPVVSSIAPAIKAIPARFGDFGGAYVPEALYDCLTQLSAAYSEARADPAFWKEWEGEFGYMNRPSRLYEAKRLTAHAGGARIWFKREDLNHTGSHKVSLSRRLLSSRH
jgi:tryptophan synthase